MKNSIAVLGSSNTDMIVKTDRIPRPGETVIGGVFSRAPGGKGANQAVAAARVGSSVVLIGRVGADAFGDEALEGYVRDGIDVSRLTRDPGAHSGVALIFVDAKGENSIAVASGANANVSDADVEGVRDCIESAAVLLMQLEIPIDAVSAAADIAAARGVRVILNPAPARALDDALLRNVSILTPNETEAELLTGISADTDRGAENAAEALRARGIETVLLTLGTRGVYVASPEYRGIVPCYPVECVDSTAAGDVFNGVLAASLAEGRSLLDAVRFASAAAAISVTRMGAQPSAPYREEIDAFLKKTDKTRHPSV
jgi:ribokinase